MKTLLVTLALALALVALPVTAGAQDWVMDWHSTGSVVTAWSITGSSPTTLTPISGGLPPFFTGQAYNLGFTWEGRGYGGAVATGAAASERSWPGSGCVWESLSLAARTSRSRSVVEPTYRRMASPSSATTRMSARMGAGARRLGLHSLLVAADVHPLDAGAETRFGVRNGFAADRADAFGHPEKSANRSVNRRPTCSIGFAARLLSGGRA